MALRHKVDAEVIRSKLKGVSKVLHTQCMCHPYSSRENLKDNTNKEGCQCMPHACEKDGRGNRNDARRE